MSRTDAFHVGSAPVPGVAQASLHYSQQNGLHIPSFANHGFDRTTITQPASKAVGRAYDALPEFDHRAVPAFKQMGEEVGRQFDYMTRPRRKGGLGVNVEVTHDDPYQEGGVDEIVSRFRHDVVNNNNLKVLSTQATGGHPLFDNDRNDQFRAVHDYFGHLGSGRGVDRNGEEAAFQKHRQMFSPEAQRALASETRGQNSSLHRNGDFAQQKIALLPRVMQSPQFAALGTPHDRLAAAAEGRQRNKDQGL